MQILYIFIGIVISTIVYLILLFLQGAKMADERNNHREMYLALKDRNRLKPYEYDIKLVREYEDRFML